MKQWIVIVYEDWCAGIRYTGKDMKRQILYYTCRGENGECNMADKCGCSIYADDPILDYLVVK